jgi:hypothetical protein
MQELATKTEAQKSPEMSVNNSHQPEIAKKPLSYTHGGFQLFRKTTCPCDGGCPRCVPIQAKLQIGEPDDEYEKEADKVADQIMRMPDPVIQSKRDCPLADTSCKEDEEEELKDKTLMKKEAQAPVRNSYVPPTVHVPPIVHDVLQSSGSLLMLVLVNSLNHDLGMISVMCASIQVHKQKRQLSSLILRPLQ